MCRLLANNIAYPHAKPSSCTHSSLQNCVCCDLSSVGLCRHHVHVYVVINSLNKGMLCAWQRIKPVVSLGLMLRRVEFKVPTEFPELTVSLVGSQAMHNQQLHHCYGWVAATTCWMEGWQCRCVHDVDHVSSLSLSLSVYLSVCLSSAVSTMSTMLVLYPSHCLHLRCDVDLEEGECRENCLCLAVLCTIIMVHKDTSSSHRSVNSIRLWSCLV